MFIHHRAAARLRRSLSLFASLATIFAACILTAAASGQSGSYTQTNIISDGSVPAQKTDPTLINPWGVSIGPDFWIDTAGTGLSLVDDAGGNKLFSVTIPPANASQPNGVPAGTVFNADTSAFTIPGKGSAQFIFGNLDGSIAAWNESTSTAVMVVNNSSTHAVYTDIAVAKNNSGTFLLAANFSAGTVDVFDSNFKAAKLNGSFSDPALPAGYKPFGIHTIGNSLYVTYAQANSNGFEKVGAGLGVVDQFDLNGNLVTEAVVGGKLNAPWGMALAPAGFGTFGGALLIGNFGDGTINAYDPASFAFKGQLSDSMGTPLANSGLWEIVFGAGTTTTGTPATAGDPNTLYFAAGVNGEKGGLFGSITAAAATGAGDFAITTTTPSVTVNAGQSASVQVSLAGDNGFKGAVALSCSGLPTGASCTFTPATVSLSGTAATAVAVSIATPAAPAPNPYSAMLNGKKLLLAGMLPLGLLGLMGFRKKVSRFRGAFPVLLCLLVLGTLAGCGGMKTAMSSGGGTTPPAPTTSQVTISASSGSLAHSVTVSLTVN